MCGEVLVLQGVDRVEASPPVQPQELFEQTKPLVAHVRTETLVNVALRIIPLIPAFAARQLRPSRHALFIGRSDQLEDAHTLIDVGLALEDGLLLEHFREDTTDAPHVDCGRVLSQG